MYFKMERKYIDLSKPYFIERELGKGGFGVTYLANQDDKKFVSESPKTPFSCRT